MTTIEIWTTPYFEYFVIPADVPFAVQSDLHIEWYNTNNGQIKHLVDVRQLGVILKYLDGKSMPYRIEKTNYMRFGDKLWMETNKVFPLKTT